MNTNINTRVMNDTLLVMCRFMDKDNRAQITKDRRKTILKILGISDQNFKQQITRLIKNDCMQREEVGSYFINPFRFARASAYNLDRSYEEYQMLKNKPFVYKPKIKRPLKQMPKNTFQIGVVK